LGFGLASTQGKLHHYAIPIFLILMPSLSLSHLSQTIRVRGIDPKQFVFCFLVVLLLAGCSLPLPYMEKPVAQKAARTAFAERRLDSVALKEFLGSKGRASPGATSGWDFETLALVSAFYSPDLSVAEARWREAIASSGMSLSLKPVQLDFLLDHHSLTEPVRPNPWVWGIGFEFVLPDADRRAAKARLANDQVALARLGLADESWKVRSVLRTVWIDYFAAEERIRLAEIEVQTLRKAFAMIARREAAGLLGRGDLQQAETTLKRAESERAEAQRTHAGQTALLRAALHLPPDTQTLPSLIALDWKDMAEVIRSFSDDQLQELALNNRLDLKEAEARYAIYDAKLRLEVAQQYPEISLKPGYEWDQGDHRIKLGVGLPIAFPAAHKAAIDTAMAERDTQGQTLLAIQERVLQELGRAKRDVVAARDRLSEIQRNQESLEHAFEQIKLSIRLGETDPIQAVEAEQKVITAKIQSLEAEVMYQKSLARLEDVLQQPLSSISLKGTQ